MLDIWIVNFPRYNLMACYVVVKYIRIYKLVVSDIFVSVLVSVKRVILTDNCFTFNPEICRSG